MRCVREGVGFSGIGLVIAVLIKEKENGFKIR